MYWPNGNKEIIIIIYFYIFLADVVFLLLLLLVFSFCNVGDTNNFRCWCIYDFLSVFRCSFILVDKWRVDKCHKCHVKSAVIIGDFYFITTDITICVIFYIIVIIILLVLFSFLLLSFTLLLLLLLRSRDFTRGWLLHDAVPQSPMGLHLILSRILTTWSFFLLIPLVKNWFRF